LEIEIEELEDRRPEILVLDLGRGGA